LKIAFFSIFLYKCNRSSTIFGNQDLNGTTEQLDTQLRATGGGERAPTGHGFLPWTGALEGALAAFVFC